jgi:GWxTD domain-containing protein
MNKYILPLIFLANVALAQRPSPTALDRDAIPLKSVYSEYIVNPVANCDSIQIFVYARADYRALSFKKNPNANAREKQYYTVINTDISFKNSENVIKARSVNCDTIYLEKNDEEYIENKFYFTKLSSTLPKGEYNAILEVSDENKKTIYSGRAKGTEQISSFKNQSVGKPIFVVKNDKDQIFPTILDNDLDFRMSDNSLLFIVRHKSPIKSLRASIKRILIPPAFTASSPIFSEAPLEKTVQAKVRQNSFLNIDKNNDNLIIELQSDPTNAFTVLEFPIDKELNFPGRYEISFNHPETGELVKYEFGVQWLNMPISLRNPKSAAEMMYYIMNDKEHDELTSTSRSNLFTAIFEYWNKIKPQNNSIYNPAMAEYFARVDKAEIKYKEIGMQQGAKTERGKTFILNGEPDAIETIPESDMTLEVWKYSKLNKTYIFESSAAGAYRLREIK